MPKTINREDLKAKLNRGESFVLINVLSPEQFQQAHIPNSINVPFDALREQAPDMWQNDAEIIVYCSSATCTASPNAARLLEELGFTNVADYKGGLADWEEANFPLHRGENAA